jgi:hypothetical protein
MGRFGAFAADNTYFKTASKTQITLTGVNRKGVSQRNPFPNHNIPLWRSGWSVKVRN